MTQECFLEILIKKMEKFEKLGLSQDVLKVLDEMGIDTPTEIQEKTIPLAMAGKDIIGGSATGSGKTLAFASPIIEKLKPSNHVQALILTPTRELAEQVAQSIKQFSKHKRLNVLPVYGGVSIDEQTRRLSTTDVVVGTPGRIIDHMERRTLRLDNIKFLVLDEVDRMFDMGFHRDVERILKDCSEERQTMLFSATISSTVNHLAQKYTINPEEITVTSYVDHSKLKQVFYDTQNNMKFSLLVHLLNNERSGLVMVFCSTRRAVDFVENNLNKSGIDSKAIHGGLSQNQRLRVLNKFNNNKVSVLVCTDVAARGLDIKGVSHVYNFDLPALPDDYIHRIGRTARAGSEGMAVNIVSNRDYDNFRNILRNDDLKIEEKELPKFEMVEIRTTFGGSQDRGGGYNRGRSSGGYGRNERPKRSGSNNRGGYGRGSPSGGNSRGNSYGNRGGSSGGRSRGSYNGSSGGNSSGGSYGNRGGSSGGRSRGPYNGSSGGNSRGNSYGNRGGSSGGNSSGGSYGNRGGSSGGRSRGPYNESSGGNSRGNSYGNRGGSSSGNSRGSYGNSRGNSSRKGPSRDGFRGRKTGNRPRR